MRDGCGHRGAAGGRSAQWEAFPEALRCLAGEAMHGGVKNDAERVRDAQNPPIEPPLSRWNSCTTEVGHPELAARWTDLQPSGTSPSMPSAGKRRFEAAHVFWMGPRFPAPAASRCAPGEQAVSFIPDPQWDRARRSWGSSGSDGAALVKPPCHAPPGHPVPGQEAAWDTPSRAGSRAGGARGAQAIINSGESERGDCRGCPSGGEARAARAGGGRVSQAGAGGSKGPAHTRQRRA